MESSYLRDHFTNMVKELCMKKNINKKACYYCKGTFDDQVSQRSSSSSPSPLMRVLPKSLCYESGFLGSVPNSKGVGSTLPVETPLQLARNLSERVGVKREDLQPAFLFKLRGAYNMMQNLSKDQLNRGRGVICLSSGNHAQGVKLAAQRLGCDAVVVMPTTAPEIKWRSVEKLGGKAVLFGASFNEAQLYAKDRAQVEGRTFVPSFDHSHIIMGQGTAGMDILRQAKEPLHAIFAPIGGGLIAGVASYVKMVCPQDMIEEEKSILESTGALALAGAEAYCKYYGLKGKNVAAITSGANMDLQRLGQVIAKEYKETT